MAKRDKSRHERSDADSKRPADIDALRARFLETGVEGPQVADTAGRRTMTKKTAEQLVQEKLVGKRVVQPAAVTPPKPDAVSRDLNELRRKYFGNTGDSTGAAASQPAQPAADTDIVIVVPTDPAADPAQAQPKGVVMTDGEETGRQG